MLSRFSSLPALVAAALAVVVGLAGCAGDPALGREALADLSELETEALWDKFVEPDEIHHATDVLVECLRQAGFNVSYVGPVDGEYLPDEVVMGYSEWSDESDRHGDSMDLKAGECESEINAISAVWVLQNESFNNRALPGLAEALDELELDE